MLHIGHRAITNSDGHKVTGLSFSAPEIIGFGRADVNDSQLYMEGGPTKTATVYVAGFGNRSRPVYMWGEIVEFVVTFNRSGGRDGRANGHYEIWQQSAGCELRRKCQHADGADVPMGGEPNVEKPHSDQ